MKELAINRDESTQPWFAARDAHHKSEICKQAYSLKNRAKADAMHYAIELCYACHATYLTYRQRFVAIKIEHVMGFHRTTLRTLEAAWESDASITVTKVVTKQGFIYRVKFA